jgi:hypothetical protein
MEAVERKVSKNMFGRMRNNLCNHYWGIARMLPQWVDIINGDWMCMSTKARGKGMGTVVRDLVLHRNHEQYCEMESDILAFVQEHNTAIDNVSVGVEYPEIEEW